MIDIEVQKAIRARLVASAEVTDLVPADSILDRNRTPAPRPSIVLGETQSLDEEGPLARNRTRVVHTIHVWATEPSRERIKAIAAEIRAELHNARLALPSGLQAVDCRVSSMRALSDPDGETSHGIVTVEVLVSEVTP